MRAVLSLAVTLALLAGGASAAAEAPMPATTPVAPPSPGGIAVRGEGGRAADLSSADLAALPRDTVRVTRDGKVTTYEGARLVDVLRAVGTPLGARLHGGPVMDIVIVTGADGYRALLSLAEADPDTHAGHVILADHADGAALDAHAGPLRLVIDGDLRPPRSVKQVVRIEVVRIK